MPEKWMHSGTAQCFPLESPLSNLAVSVLGTDLEQFRQGAGAQHPSPGLSLRQDSGCSIPIQSWPGAPVPCWHSSQAALPPWVHLSNYQHIFLCSPVFERLPSTLPYLYKKHSLIFVFLCSSFVFSSLLQPQCRHPEQQLCPEQWITASTISEMALGSHERSNIHVTVHKAAHQSN